MLGDKKAFVEKEFNLVRPIFLVLSNEPPLKIAESIARNCRNQNDNFAPRSFSDQFAGRNCSDFKNQR